jgi:hypothetical protein
MAKKNVPRNNLHKALSNEEMASLQNSCRIDAVVAGCGDGGHLLESILGAVIVKGTQVSFLGPAVGLLSQPA